MAFFCLLMIRRPPRSTLDRSSAASDVYKRQVQRVYANKAVVLCGGAINSPQLLELSGIGNAALLSPLGIETNHELPGVGENLQDHLTVHVQQGLRNTGTFFEETRALGLIRNALRFGFKRQGLLIHLSLIHI